MKRFILILFLLPTVLFAQEKGIKFSNNLNWAEVKEKAKAENKYIMMDCYTSWCVPCKIMEQQVFTDSKIGEFSNQNYVSVQVQFDDDPEANEVKKEWMKLSKEFDKNYQVDGYPCYLFFNPNGEIVHKAYGKREISNFLNLLQKVPNPDFQYYTLRKKYEENKQDKTILKKLLNASMEAEPEDKQDLIKAYLSQKPAIETKAEAQVIMDVTRSSQDIGFPLLLNQAKKIDSLLGEIAAEDLYRGIINFEDAANKLGRKSPMGYYILTSNPDWSIFQDTLVAKYPNHSTELLDFIKLNFYKNGLLMHDYVPALKAYIQKYDQTISDRMKMEYVGVFAKKSKETELIKELLTWSRDAFEKSEDVENLSNYALLNYKVGEKEKGISLMEKAITKAEENQLYDLNENLDLMKKGENIL